MESGAHAFQLWIGPPYLAPNATRYPVQDSEVVLSFREILSLVCLENLSLYRLELAGPVGDAHQALLKTFSAPNMQGAFSIYLIKFS